MSKIFGVRMVNINYNHNTMKIDDEYYEMAGDSTLISLRNGGGKSVLVQMMIAPFVHKRFRNTKDRTFASFFTTNRPSFIMVEWKLDGSNKKVLTGMMVRRNQDTKEDNDDELEMITFIHEYNSDNQYDIKSFPLIESSSGVKQLKGFQTCKKIFEECKQQKGTFFNYYDMNNSSQQKNYFDKLKQYQIHYKEWETIIKKVNLKESGLSELFTEAKDEHGLVEKWFLPAIEDKLNQEENRIHQFEVILLKYIKQYKENQSKFERKEMILNFKEETIPIYEHTKSYKESLINKKEMENKIASFLLKLEGLIHKEEILKEEIYKKYLQCEQQLKAIHYEKDSLKIYGMINEEQEYEKLIYNKRDEIQELLKEISSIKTKQNILQCAKYYGAYQEDSKEVQRIERKLELVMKKDEDLLPERNQIGYNLRLYYEKEEKRLRSEMKELEEQLVQWKNRISEIKLLEEELLKAERDNAKTIGRLQSEISRYNVSEKIFNEKYEESLARNILGYYEKGALEQIEHQTHKTLNDKQKKFSETKKRILDLEQEGVKYNRDIQDCQSFLGTIRAQLLSEEKLKLRYDEELTDRKAFLQVLSLPEEELLNHEKILFAFDLKIEEMNNSIHLLQKDGEDLLNQFKKMESGKVLELSKELSEALDSTGIQYIYGMEWLSKNDYTVSKNQQLVKDNPFLPFSLIMSKRECEKFMKAELDVFTSHPIPIVLREYLESASLEQFNQNIEMIKFYILFNEKLLDENELAIMLSDIKEQIKLTEKSIDTKKEERSYYTKKRDSFLKQLVTKDEYKRCEQNLKELQDDVKKKEELIFKLKESLDLSGKEKKQAEQEGRSLEQVISMLNSKEKDLTLLKEEYQGYLESQDERRYLEEQNELRAKELKILAEEESTKHEELREKEKDREHRVHVEADVQKQVSFYASFKEGEVMQKDIEDLKARFEAITATVLEEQKSLEEQLSLANKRFKVSEDELIHYSKKYDVVEKDYREVVYDRFLEEELESSLKARVLSEESKKKEESDLTTKKAVLEKEISIERKNFLKAFQTETLKPKEEIVIRDFNEEISLMEIHKKDLEEQIRQTDTKRTMYDENLSSLSEYSELVAEEAVDFLENFEAFGKKEWNLFRGSMVRDYKQSDKEAGENRQAVSECLQQVLGKPSFLDEFYHNPLSRFYELRTEPSMLLEQIEIVWNSFDNLLEKLEIDIAFLGKEKQKVIEMLLDYVEDAHVQMNQIDKKSSISIRGRSIKMLRMKLPDWQEQEEIYRLRMQDFLDAVFIKGLASLEKNEQIEEVIGKEVTTRNLYDRVIGIGNVEIKLYKIEEQREYPISWAEVAKNSGGEGFLSAFVILSSLLSFMRRDETDIFSEREESKVLVMDNPFAQTSAAHLLKPLMEVAEKSNTQLICLSGLGGDSIYNRFDQIYVLNLIPSSLRSGVSYIRSEHVKGEEHIEHLSQLVSARIKVEEMEQIKLF